MKKMSCCLQPLYHLLPSPAGLFALGLKMSPFAVFNQSMSVKYGYNTEKSYILHIVGALFVTYDTACHRPWYETKKPCPVTRKIALYSFPLSLTPTLSPVLSNLSSTDCIALSKSSHASRKKASSKNLSLSTTFSDFPRVDILLRPFVVGPCWKETCYSLPFNHFLEIIPHACVCVLQIHSRNGTWWEAGVRRMGMTGETARKGETWATGAHLGWRTRYLTLSS